MKSVVIAMAIAGILSVTPAVAQTTESTGWDLELLVLNPALDAKTLRAAVLKALPGQLMDREANFTRHESYNPQKNYHIVLAIHQDGQDPMIACGRPVSADGVAAVPVANPPPARTTSQRLSGVLCEDQKILTQGSQKTLGELRPGDMGFRYLVADVMRQLFPLGYATLEH